MKKTTLPKKKVQKAPPKQVSETLAPAIAPKKKAAAAAKTPVKDVTVDAVPAAPAKKPRKPRAKK